MEPIMTAKQELASVRRQLEELWRDYNYEMILTDLTKKNPPNDQRPYIKRQIDALSAREAELKVLVAKLDKAVGPRPRYVR